MASRRRRDDHKVWCHCGWPHAGEAGDGKMGATVVDGVGSSRKRFKKVDVMGDTPMKWSLKSGDVKMPMGMRTI